MPVPGCNSCLRETSAFASAGSAFPLDAPLARCRKPWCPAVPSLLSAALNQEIHLRTRCRAVEPRLRSRRNGVQYVLGDEAYPTRACNRMTEQLLPPGDSQQGVDDPAIADINLGVAVKGVNSRYATRPARLSADCLSRAMDVDPRTRNWRLLILLRGDLRPLPSYTLE